MSNEGQKPGQGSGGRSNNGFIPTSFRAISSYLRIVSSGASTVASTVRSAASAASAIVEKETDSSHDQVQWAGFDKLECEGGTMRQVLLLAYQHGFQVWDVEKTDDICNIVSKRDGPVSFIQAVPKPIKSKQLSDKFADSRPMLIICADVSFSGGSTIQEGSINHRNGAIQHSHDPSNGGFVPTVVWFYSLRSHSYVHLLKFRSVVHLVRCSSRIIAILQGSQIHCFNAATLERVYTVVTNPVVTGCFGVGGIGFGPLALGPRWMAYSGSPIAVSSSGRVSPQNLTSSASFPSPGSNGSLVAHYAKESSKQLAAGLMTLGDRGYKKLSRYYSELLPDGNHSHPSGAHMKSQGIANGHSPDADHVGMVIVRDIVSKTVISQFRAHKSPISSLCFNPSGIILVTASVQGHNINVFWIMSSISENSSGSDSGPSYVHLYRLQRGFTNAVIQDINFSNDSHWIMISTSRGTSHLFAISPSGGSVNFQSISAATNYGSGVMKNSPSYRSANSGVQMLNQQSICTSGPPITLSVVGRIRSGSNGWKNTVSGAAAAATGKSNSLSGAIASVFHNSECNNLFSDPGFLKNYRLLVFSPLGCLIQYAFHMSSAPESAKSLSVAGSTCELGGECDARLTMEALQKWNICLKQTRKEREENIDIYGEFGNSDSSKVFPEGMRKENGSVYSKDAVASKHDNFSSEEKCHMYISEAELQMHQSWTPLWAKPEIYFQAMRTDGKSMDMQCAFGGEIEIERVPTRMIEARSKDLVPVFDYVQAPMFLPGRTTVFSSSNNEQLLSQGSEVSEDIKSKHGASSGSLHSVSDGGLVVTELRSVTEENGLQMARELPLGFVNNNEIPRSNTRLELVNNREQSSTETHFKYVNNKVDGLKMENQFEDEGEEFD